MTICRYCLEREEHEGDCSPRALCTRIDGLTQEVRSYGSILAVQPRPLTAEQRDSRCVDLISREMHYIAAGQARIAEHEERIEQLRGERSGIARRKQQVATRCPAENCTRERGHDGNHWGVG